MLLLAPSGIDPQIMNSRLKVIGQNGTQICIYNQNLKISQLGKSGRIEEAIKIFEQMTHRNTVTFNSMISAYAKNGMLKNARHTFDQMSSRNLVSWNSMIAGYLHNEKADEAYQLFHEMPKRDSFSWALMITCYSRKGDFERAKKAL